MSNFWVALVALLHVGFLVLEMFLWTTPLGRKISKYSPEKAETTKVVAANQGLYNGFLAAGLVWSIFAACVLAFDLKIFFLTCVIIAAVYGGWSARSRGILLAQGGPALIALVVTIAFANPYLDKDYCSQPPGNQNATQ